MRPRVVNSSSFPSSSGVGSLGRVKLLAPFPHFAPLPSSHRTTSSNLMIPNSLYNGSTILLGASSLSLVTTYPLMKRVPYWPQAVLGTLSLLSTRPPNPRKTSTPHHLKRTHPPKSASAQPNRTMHATRLGLTFNWVACFGRSCMTASTCTRTTRA